MRRPVSLAAALLVIIILLADLAAGYPSCKLHGYENERITLTGRITDVTEKDEGFFKCVLKTENYRILVNIYSEIIKEPRKLLYRNVTVTGVISIPESRSNPNCFDNRRYLQSNGIYTLMEATGIDTDHGYGDMFHRITAGLRNHTLDYLEENMTDEGFGITAGILFGATEYLSEDTAEVFRRGGTAHILAVSGLHLGIIYAFLCRYRKRKRSIPFDTAVSAVLLLYAAMVGFTPSVMRALTVIFIHTASEHMNRRFDFFSAVCASMILMLLISPYRLFSVGFQMTYLAALSMAVIYPYLSEKTKDPFLVPVISIQAGMLPYQAYVFNYISPVALFSNIPIAVISSFIVPLGFLMIPLSYIPYAGILPLHILGILADILKFCNDFTYMGGHLSFDVVSPPVFIVAGWYVMLFLICTETGMIWQIRKEKKRIFSVILCALIVSFPVGYLTDDGFRDCEIVFVDVGQGDCMHIRSGDNNYLIDGGGSETYETGKKILKPYLLKNGVRKIDGAFVSHLHTDHYKGICELAKEGMIKRIYVYESNRLKIDRICEETGLDEEQITFLRKGMTVKLKGGDLLQILWPEKKSDDEYMEMIENEEDENASSLIIKVTVKGVSMLATGDMGEDGERELITDCGSDLDSDILKVGHHGSRYSTCDGFLDAVDPGYAVIQVGKNNPLLAKEYDIVSK